MQTTLDVKTSKKILELALDQQEESEPEDDFGGLDATRTPNRTAPRPTKQIDEGEDEDDEGTASFDDGEVDLDAELELVSL